MNRIFLSDLLTDIKKTPTEQCSIFALLNLGLIESLGNGTISATEAVDCFFHADNCLFVHNHFYDRDAEAVMSHGVQLPDLFAVLPPQQAQREFQRELSAMRALCYTLLHERELAV
ncbi:MAG: hypothetical protein KDE47_10575 [Caldilineaceae bacterium]|nr:hypothetical protein [Caldilineaceae bacterium]